MRFTVKGFLLLATALGTSAIGANAGQDQSQLTLADIEEAYQSLRDLPLDSTRVLPVESCLIQRDVATFAFESGNLYFFRPVLGSVVAAVFRGEGTFSLSTDDQIEKQQIRRFTGKEFVGQRFTRALLVFTDSTYEQLTLNMSVRMIHISRDLRDEASDLRRDARQRFLENIDARILSDVVMGRRGHFFRCYFECPADQQFRFTIDPLNDEEVDLFRYRKDYASKRALSECWYSAHTNHPLTHLSQPFDVEMINIDASIDSKRMLRVTAQLRLVNYADSLRLMNVVLSPTLAVEEAVLDSTESCLVIREPDDLDAALWLALPTPLLGKSKHMLTLKYSGDEVVWDIGSGNFVVVERTSWYPSLSLEPPDPARVVMRFRVPKGMELLGTGRLIRRWDEGNASCSEWDSEVAFTTAGFNYGEFATVSEEGPSATIGCYTNTRLSTELFEFRRLLEESSELRFGLMMLPQEVTTEGIGKNAAIECRNAYETYVHFFGKIPFRNILVSQQGQESFAQSWPGLLYLPYTSFLDPAVKEKLGLLSTDKSALLYETLASHEMGHQWWGHTVMSDTYHDNWLNEGFATYSAALYLQATAGTERFLDYMKILQSDILWKPGGHRRATDLGPIWLGSRLSSLDTPWGGLLVYSKGAYVLHMLRMMMFDYKTKSDSSFIAMMQDFVASQAGKLTSTEDFKRIVERHFEAPMDWFFDQWVYGTEIPVYEIRHHTELAADGKYILTVTATQQGVEPSFTMPIHIAINFEKGHAIASMLVTGSEPITQEFVLPMEPKSIEPNPLNGVLCEIKQ